MPSAAARVSINGGANQTIADKPIIAPSAATVAFSSADTSFWTQQRWEIYAYPDGWTAPAGWSTDANGVIYSTSVTPSSFTLDSNLLRWGKFGLRLTVNNGLTDGVADTSMVDESLAFEVLSPSGLHDLMKYETNQFGDDWTEQQRENLRIAEGYTGALGYLKTYWSEVTTTDNTPTELALLPAITNGVMTIDTCVTAARASSATKGGRWKASATYRYVAGTPTLVGSIEYATAHETDAGMDIEVDINIVVPRVRVTGVTANTINWFSETRVQVSSS
jgi:hypothetical protein